MDTLIKKAKQFPITRLYKGELKPTGKILFGHCPFHEDRTPSFAIYPSTNTYNCFAGCQWGDSITFYQKTYNVDFKTAVKELCKLS